MNIFSLLPDAMLRSCCRLKKIYQIDCTFLLKYLSPQASQSQVNLEPTHKWNWCTMRCTLTLKSRSQIAFFLFIIQFDCFSRLEVFYNWHVVYLLMISSQQRYGTINVIITHSWKCPTGFSTYMNLLQSEANQKRMNAKGSEVRFNKCSYFRIENCIRNVINRKCHSMQNENQSQMPFALFFSWNFLNIFFTDNFINCSN